MGAMDEKECEHNDKFNDLMCPFWVLRKRIFAIIIIIRLRIELIITPLKWLNSTQRGRLMSFFEREKFKASIQKKVRESVIGTSNEFSIELRSLNFSTLSLYHPMMKCVWSLKYREEKFHACLSISLLTIKIFQATIFFVFEFIRSRKGCETEGMR